jgi:hypothetical protein
MMVDMRVDHILYLLDQLDARGIKSFGFKYFTLHGMTGHGFVDGFDEDISVTFPELEFLTLSGCATSWFLPSLANFSKLRTLCLRHIHDIIEPIDDLVYDCSHLRKLIVSGYNTILGGTSPDNALLSGSLESIEVEGFALDELLQHSHFPRVRHLKMLGEAPLEHSHGPGPVLPNLKIMEIVKSPAWDLTPLFDLMSDTSVRISQNYVIFKLAVT